MKQFENGMRVWVRCDAEGREVAAYGSVARLRRADDGAWIALEARHSREALHPFPADDSRGTHLLAYPEDCDREVAHA